MRRRRRSIRGRSRSRRGQERVGAVLTAAMAAVLASSGLAAGSSDWKSEWAVADGFRLTIDTSGYQLPTAIAFVRDPGRDPKDPLYFVTELRGLVKVVTNDRTVHTFARVRALQPELEAPHFQGQAGLGGICLDPDARLCLRHICLRGFRGSSPKQHHPLHDQAKRLQPSADSVDCIRLDLRSLQGGCGAPDRGVSGRRREPVRECW